MRIWLADSRLDTVRISAAGQTLGAVISPWVCALASSVPLRTAQVPSFVPLAAATKTVPGPTPNGGWESRETRRQTLSAQVCTAHFACAISKRYFAPREGACRFRVHPRWPAPRVFILILVLCRQRTRWQRARGRRRFYSTGTSSLRPIVREKRS